MAAKNPEERLDRLEQVVQVIAEDQLSLQKLIAELATETRRGFDRVALQFEETDKRFRQTDDRIDRLAQEAKERARYFDERVDKLVVAIGEFIRQPSTQPGPAN